MRVLMASDFYAPFIGGAERQVRLLGRELARRGHEVRVATVWQEGLPGDDEDEGVRVHRVRALATRTGRFSGNPRQRHHPPLPDPAVVLGVRRLAREMAPDVVHAHGWIAYSCAAALLGSRVPLVVSARDYGYGCATRTLLRRGKVCAGPAPTRCLGCASERYGLAKGAAAVAGVLGGRALLGRTVGAFQSVSGYVAGTVRRDVRRLANGDGPAYRGGRDVVIPSFLEQENLEGGVDGALAGLPEEPFVLFVGALQAHKGVGTLLAAHERLAAPPPLVLIGASRHDSPEAFPAGMTILRDVPHGAVMAAWDRSLFGVAPGMWAEPLGNVVLEAMSRGKAVIASGIGGPAETVVHEETGLLVPPGDVGALAAAMGRLIDDPSLRERMGRAARVRSAGYEAAAIVPRFEALYREVIAAAGEGRTTRVADAGV